jgi:hypothetical protein
MSIESSSSIGKRGESKGDAAYDTLESLSTADIDRDREMPGCNTPDGHIIYGDTDTVPYTFCWAGNGKKVRINRAEPSEPNTDGRWLQIELALWP